MQPQCPNCHALLPPDAKFCSQCGTKIIEDVETIPISRQISVYAMSVLLPPLGLVPAFRYLRRPQPKVKRVGMIALVLTIISTVVTIVVSIQFLNQFNKALNTQLNQLQF